MTQAGTVFPALGTGEAFGDLVSSSRPSLTFCAFATEAHRQCSPALLHTSAAGQAVDLARRSTVSNRSPSSNRNMGRNHQDTARCRYNSSTLAIRKQEGYSNRRRDIHPRSLSRPNFSNRSNTRTSNSRSQPVSKSSRSHRSRLDSRNRASRMACRRQRNLKHLRRPG